MPHSIRPSDRYMFKAKQAFEHAWAPDQFCASVINSVLPIPNQKWHNLPIIGWVKGAALDVLEVVPQLGAAAWYTAIALSKRAKGQ